MFQLQFNVEFYILLLLTLFLAEYGIAPNIGDVRLFKQTFNSEKETYSGEIQIYLGYGHSPANWSKICRSNSFDRQETTILCEQMNLEYSSSSFVSSGPSDYPTFISNIECKDKIFLHILQCNYDLRQTECADVVNIVCAKPNKAAKNGKLEICPPDQVDTSTIMSTSFGVVGIHLNDHWRGIGADKFIKGASNIADLMCISLGYQRSVPSIGTVKALAGTYTFTKCAERYENFYWISMTSLVEKCKSEPQYQCLGCCYKNPMKSACGVTSCSENFVVLQCTYDFFYESEKRQNSKLERTSCILKDSKHGATIDQRKAYCPKKSQEVLALNITTGILAVLLIISCISFIVCCIFFRTLKRCLETLKERLKRNDGQAYNQMDQDENSRLNNIIPHNTQTQQKIPMNNIFT